MSQDGKMLHSVWALEGISTTRRVIVPQHFKTCGSDIPHTDVHSLAAVVGKRSVSGHFILLTYFQ